MVIFLEPSRAVYLKTTYQVPLSVLCRIRYSTERGVQFTSKAYYDLIVGMMISYSEKGNPWDNACIESFHSLIKREWLNRQKIMDYNQAYQLVFEYIEGFYNTIRTHSHCGYVSPNEYERQFYYDN